MTAGWARPSRRKCVQVDVKEKSKEESERSTSEAEIGESADKRDTDRAPSESFD